jgi:tetratricopeptide (TPR) repeat protein
MARSDSLPAQETLLYYAAELYLPALADRTARRARELGGNVPGRVHEPAGLQELSHDTLGPGSSIEDLERFEIAQLHLTGQDPHGALRWLDDMEQPSARNNRAVALFHLQRVDEALAVLMDVWQAHPDNLFALSWAIQLRLYRGDEDGALGLCTPLAAGVPLSLDHALPQLQVLLLMQQNEPALAAFRAAQGHSWEEAAAGRSGALLRHCGMPPWGSARACKTCGKSR